MFFAKTRIVILAVFFIFRLIYVFMFKSKTEHLYIVKPKIHLGLKKKVIMMKKKNDNLYINETVDEATLEKYGYEHTGNK